jgi:hypothetical protein
MKVHILNEGFNGVLCVWNSANEFNLREPLQLYDIVSWEVIILPSEKDLLKCGWITTWTSIEVDSI